MIILKEIFDRIKNDEWDWFPEDVRKRLKQGNVVYEIGMKHKRVAQTMTVNNIPSSKEEQQNAIAISLLPTLIQQNEKLIDMVKEFDALLFVREQKGNLTAKYKRNETQALLEEIEAFNNKLIQ